MVLMPGFQSTQLATEGALEPFFFLYTDDSIQGNPETCKQSSIMLNYEVKNTVAFHTPSICLEMQGIRIEIHEQAGADVIRNTLLALRQLC